MPFKNPNQLVDSFEDDDVYGEWENSVLTEQRKKSQPTPMASRLSDSPLTRMNPDTFYKLGFDKDLSDRVVNHIQKYEGVADKYATDIENIVNGLGGQMAGIEYRLKRPQSLARKILANIDEKKKAGVQNYGYDEAFKDIKDTARFTAVYDMDNFEQKVYNTLNQLRNNYKLTKFKNQFADSGAYRGLNTVMQDADGNMFELQFHIPSSIKAKEGIDIDVLGKKIMLNKSALTSHDFYETTRMLENKILKGEATPREQRLYEILMQKALDHVKDIPQFNLNYEY